MRQTGTVLKGMEETETMQPETVQPDSSDDQAADDYRSADLLVKAQVPRSDIQMLVKLVEGLGHLGVVTTTDKAEGIVLIQTTRDCWPDLSEALKSMPLAIRFMEILPPIFPHP